MYNRDGNTNKRYYLNTDTYLVIFSAPDHPGYLVKGVTPPCNHPILCDDLNLYGAYVCFPTQGRLLCSPKPYFSRTIAYHLRRLVYQNLQYPSLFPKRRLKCLILFHTDGIIV